MEKPTRMIFKKILYSPFTKIIIGISLIIIVVFSGELLRNNIINKTSLSQNWKNVVIGSLQIVLAIFTYILLFRTLEKRKISELSTGNFLTNTFWGCTIGTGTQSLVILLLYWTHNYSITKTNPLSFLIPGLISALVAGFVMEIILRGILFRVVEEYLGTSIAIMFLALLFLIVHTSGEHATTLSVLATTIQAGIFLSSLYIFSKSLWLPIFFHFAWDFAEPSIFGGINPGISVEESLFTSKITGPEIFTGGLNGPGNSIQAATLCLVLSIIFLRMGKRKGNFIKPYWRR